LFGGVFAKFLWWSPLHRFALLLFWNMLLFDMFFGAGGVSTAVVVFQRQWWCWCYLVHALCFVVTRVLFPGFCFRRVFCYLMGWSGSVPGFRQQN
jgi:hypothetical protein